jgi:hypothetical protein
MKSKIEDIVDRIVTWGTAILVIMLLLIGMIVAAVLLDKALDLVRLCW